MALLGGLLDNIGLKDTLGTGGLLGGLYNAYGGQDNLQGLLLALGGHEAPGMYLMNRQAQRQASEEFNRQFPGILGNQAITGPGPIASPSMRPLNERVYSENEFNPLDAKVATPQELSHGVPQFVPQQYRPVMGKAAVDQDLPVDMLARQTRQESGFNPNAVSPAGAQGISQFMPATAREMNINPSDPNQAIPAQAAYLRQNIDKFGGSTPLGLAAYNWGPGKVQNWMNQGADVSKMPAETQGYIRNVMGAQPQVAQGPQATMNDGPSPKALGLMRMMMIPNLPEAQRKLAETLLAQEMPKATDDIREFEYARRQGFNGTLEQWMQRKRSGAGEYGLQPIWGTDPATGEPAILQLGKGGEAVRSKIPDGIKVGKDAIKIDAGTEWILLDPVTRQAISRVPKNIEGKEAAEKRGQAAGTAQVNLPTMMVKAQQSLELIDAMIAHPGRETATGLSSRLDPRNYIAGTDATDFQVRQKQMQGRTFLEAFESLRGGGAITEIEGQKAEQAIARLNSAQSDKAYLEALNELKGIITRGMAVARQKAAGNFNGQTQAASQQPETTSQEPGWRQIAPGVRVREVR